MVNTNYIHIYNVILNNTVTQLFTILTKYFLSISEPYKLIPGFVLNFSFYLLIFLKGVYLSSKEFIALRKLIIVKSTFFPLRFKRLDQSASKRSKIKFSGSNFDEPLLKTLDLLEGGLVKVSGDIKNWGRWSEIVAVILQQKMSFEMTLLKILSIRVLEWLVCRLGWIIYGK